MKFEHCWSSFCKLRIFCAIFYADHYDLWFQDKRRFCRRRLGALSVYFVYHHQIHAVASVIDLITLGTIYIVCADVCVKHHLMSEFHSSSSIK